MKTWKVQEAKSRLSEVMDKAQSEGPQIITEHGTETSVVLSIEEYRRLTGPKDDFIQHLLDFPKVDDFELPPRQIDPPRELNLWEDDEIAQS